MIARVSGRRIVNVVPWPTVGADVHGAAQVLDPVLDDVHADAAPGDLGDRLGGAQARVPDERHELAVGQRRRPRHRPTRPLATILRRIRSQSIPRPSSLTVMTTLLPRCEACERDGPGAGLAGGLAELGRLQPVVDRVAHHVDQRVAQLVDHPLVQLGLLAADLEHDFLAGREAEVADDPAEPLEERADRHHPGVEHPLLQAVGDPAQAVDRLGERLELLARPRGGGSSSSWISRKLSRSRRTCPAQRSTEPSLTPAFSPAMPSMPRVMLSSRSSVSVARAWALEPRKSSSSPLAMSTNRALLMTSSPARFIR